jgi:hypothetical protein
MHTTIQLLMSDFDNVKDGQGTTPHLQDGQRPEHGVRTSISLKTMHINRSLGTKESAEPALRE